MSGEGGTSRNPWRIPWWTWAAIGAALLLIATYLDHWAWSQGPLKDWATDRYFLGRLMGYGLTWTGIVIAVALAGRGRTRPPEHANLPMDSALTSTPSIPLPGALLRVLSLLERLRLDWLRAACLTGAVLSATATGALLKLVFRRLRPHPETWVHFDFRPWSERTLDGGGLSFPSEHAAVAFAGAAYMARLIPGTGPVWYVWAAACAWSRVIVRDHHLSDVTAGALLGLALGHAFWTLSTRIAPPPACGLASKPESPSPRETLII